MNLLSRVLSAVFIAATFTTFAVANEIPLKAFASLPAVSGVSLSPDGKKVLMTMRIDSKTDDKGGMALLVYHIDTGEKSYPLYNDSGKFRIGRAIWGNNTKILVSAIYAERRDGVPTTETRLLILDTETKKLRNAIPKNIYKRLDYRPQFQDQIVDLMPGDEKHFLLKMGGYYNTADTTVYKVSLEKPSMKRYSDRSISARDWMTDRQHNLRIAIKRTETEVEILHKFPKGKWKKLWQYELFTKDAITPLGFDSDPNILYMFAIHKGYDAIFTVNLKDETLTRTLVYAHDNYDVGGDIFYSTLAKKVIGITDGSETGITFFDEEYRALQKGIDKGIPDSINTIESLSSDENRYILFSRSTKDAGAFLLGDRNNKSLSALAFRYPSLDPKNMVAKQAFSYKARDGLEIEGFYSLPNNRKNQETLPTLIFPHGGPISHNGRGFDYWTQFFANRGYAVIQMNFRGSSGYGHNFMKAGLQNWGLAMQDDVADAAHWAIKKGIADPEKICILGASYGGYAALMGAVKTPELYKCAVSFAGVTNVNLLRIRHKKYIDSEIFDKQVGDNRKKLRAISPVNHVDKISIPVLLIHGDKDRVVDVKQSRQMHQRLTKAKKDVKYVELEEGNHYLSINENRIKTFEAIEAFLASHLKK